MNQVIVAKETDHPEWWENFLNLLRDEVGDDTFENFFKGLNFAYINDDTLTCTVLKPHTKRMLENWYAGALSKALKSASPEVSSVKITLRNISREIIPIKETRRSTPKTKGVPLGKTELSSSAQTSATFCYKNQTFDSWVTAPGSANARITDILKNAIRGVFQENFMWIIGEEGSGKSHLLRASAQYAQQKGSVTFIDAERTLLVQNPSGLYLDDIEEVLGGKGSKEIILALRCALASNTFVAITSRNPPSEMPRRLLKPFEKHLPEAMVLSMKKLNDVELRLFVEQQVEKTKKRHPRFDVPLPVREAIVEQCQTPRKIIEGIKMLLTLWAYSDEVLSKTQTIQALESFSKKSLRKPVKIADIQRCVCTYHEVIMADLISSTRRHAIARPRQIAMYITRILTKRSLPEIGRRFGNRDHTTVLHAVRKIEELKANDPEFETHLEFLINELEK